MIQRTNPGQEIGKVDPKKQTKITEANIEEK